MSGIFGLCYLDGRPVDAAIPARMSAVIKHRGPDAGGLWCDGPVALGHRMLWNTPESLQERQPHVAQGGELVITADARIDNRDELIAMLRLNHRPPSELADSELILRAYEMWGEDCVKWLLGDFAFAIWDHRQHRLFCARDHFGVKPFYYYYTANLVVFASEIKAILCVPGVPRRLNEVMVGDYLTRNFEDKAITFYEDILRLPQANYLLVNERGKQIQQYWAPDLTKELRLRSHDEYAEAFRETFTAAVQCRVRSAFPVGSTLSGGLDSSSVACTASRMIASRGSGRLHTFSAIYPSLAQVDPRIDERPFIEAVLKSGEFEPHYIYADQLTPLVDRFWQGDEVIIGVNLYMDHAFCNAARQEGIRVLLSGHDGDTVVSHGYERLAELARTFRWMTLFHESAALAQRRNVRRRSVLWRQGFKPLLYWFPYLLGQRQGNDNSVAQQRELAINPQFARQIALANRARRATERPAKAKYSVRMEHWEGLNSGLYAYVMEMVDKVAAPFSIEPRHPFFDKRLVELCIALPLEQKLRGGWSRAILRHAMADIVPPDVQWRTSKGNLGANFDLGLVKRDDLLQEVIFKDSSFLTKYVDLSHLRQMYRQYKAEPLGGGPAALSINCIVLLALWLQNSKLAP